jgi:hypothetical protein
MGNVGSICRVMMVALALALLAACASHTPSAPTATREPRLAATRSTESAPTNAPTPLAMGPRRPRGIYAEIHVDLQIDQQQKVHPSIKPADTHAFLTNLYSSLLDNPAVSGLALGVNWGTLNPNPPSSSQPYDWSYMDDAFASVATWNTKNPTGAPKTIQVQVSAGFGAPQWVLDQIPSCDGLFQSPPKKPPSNCGKATFVGFAEGGGGVLPMPWDPFSRKSFETFLTALAGRYGANSAFVSMDVSGPTAASTEMILPNNLNTPNQSQLGGITPNEMWLRLLAFAFPGKPAYTESDQAFIDEWNAAIDMFGEIFRGVTLVATTGSGLPRFSNTGFTVPTAFKEDCPSPDMDCAAEATILSHFVDPAVGGANAKATQSSGMKGLVRTGSFNLGVHAAAWLSQSTAQLMTPSARILGGQQFATSAALYSVEEGCTSRFPPGPRLERSAGGTDPSALPVADIPQACLTPGVTQRDLAGYKRFSDVPGKDLISPEQAIYNVLRVFFDGTPAAASFGGTPGTATYNFLQIYNQDIKYATADVNGPAQVVQSGGAIASASAQDLLNLASQKLLGISASN